MNIQIKNKRTLLYSSFTIFFVVYLLHFINIVRFAVNIPYWDEWETVNYGGILSNPSLAQIFAQHNEHRIVTIRLLMLLLYQLNGWNIGFHQSLNFLIYGVLIFLIIWVIKRCVPNIGISVILCFAVFLLSTVSYENHSWAFQTEFHFALLFMILSIWFLFNEDQTFKNLFLGVFTAWLTIYSLSSGLVESIVIVAAFTLFKLKHFWIDKNKNELFQVIFVDILIVAAICAYFIGFERPSYHPSLVLPFTAKFWYYFFNLLSGGFGYKSESIVPGFFIFLFASIPVAFIIWKSRGLKPNFDWILVVSILAIFSALAAITMGRAGFDVVVQSKSSRYCEITDILIPLSVGIWCVVLRGKERARNYLLICFWIFCMVSFSRYWDFPSTYRNIASERLAGVECIKNYYANGGEANCQTVYPNPLTERLEFAKTLKLSFVEDAQK